MSLTTRYETEDDGWVSRRKLIIEHNGKIIREEYDGGEPEDQSFYRDWAWVADAIEQAYQLGVKDGSSK